MLTLSSQGGTVQLQLLPEVGGRIHSLTIDGKSVLRTPPDPDQHRRDPLRWGSYPMVPWCNRIPGGRLRFEGRTWPQPAEFEGHAIHGRGFDVPWREVDQGVLELDDSGDAGYPWPYLARQVFEVMDTGLALELSLENRGDAPMPAGLGIHPWFAAHGALSVELPAELVYPSTGNLPTGNAGPVDARTDLRSLGAPGWGVDECWTGLTDRRIGLRRDDGLALDYRFSETADHVVLAAISELDAIAIEPQTHAVDGHARAERGEPGGIAVLAPGERLAVRYELVRSVR